MGGTVGEGDVRNEWVGYAWWLHNTVPVVLRHEHPRENMETRQTCACGGESDVKNTRARKIDFLTKNRLLEKLVHVRWFEIAKVDTKSDQVSE